MNADSIEIPGKIPIHSVFAFTKGFLDLTQAPHPDIDGNLRLITTAQSSTGGEQRSRLKSAVFGLLLGQLWTLEKRQPSKPTGEEIAEWFVGILEEVTLVQRILVNVPLFSTIGRYSIWCISVG